MKVRLLHRGQIRTFLTQKLADGRDVVVFTTITSDKLPGAIKDVEGKVDKNVSGRQAFTLDLSGTDLMALISARASPAVSGSARLRHS